MGEHGSPAPGCKQTRPRRALFSPPKHPHAMFKNMKDLPSFLDSMRVLIFFHSESLSFPNFSGHKAILSHKQQQQKKLMEIKQFTFHYNSNQKAQPEILYWHKDTWGREGWTAIAKPTGSDGSWKEEGLGIKSHTDTAPIPAPTSGRFHSLSDPEFLHLDRKAGTAGLSGQ